MKIGVCLKQVPATDTRIRVNPTATGILTDDVKWEISPYDEYALEEAIRLKQAGKGTEVVIFTLGEAAADARIRDALARGADRAVRLDDPAFAGSDALGKARILAAAIEQEGIGLVLAGRQSVDTDTGAVPAMLAELLSWRQASWVDKLVIEGEAFTAHRAASGGTREVVTGRLPAVITCDKGLNEPRYATLPGIMAAKKKAIVVKNAAALSIDASTVGAGAAIVVEDAMSLPPARPAGRILQGDAATVAAELVRLLREEAKVI
ncbi:MAG: electron transfer flavoprotein subunit beta/FixA family protein [Pseudomonadota bacterium]|nr:electron transfer flavoprotein subunit beta/FixA family protein [Pseudomonadota bacterium]